MAATLCSLRNFVAAVTFCYLIKNIMLLSSLIAGLIGAGATLIASKKSNKYASHMTDRQIAAQQQMNERNVQAVERANAANIASQEKINQSQIDFQKDINSIMRHDAKHAISDKRADLMRAGYSTADPSLSGFSAASLSSPTLTAPQVIPAQVESEFSPQVAAQSIIAKNSSISNAVSMAKTLSDIALARAQRQKTSAETEGIVKNNAWIDLEKNASYATMLENLEIATQTGKLKQKEVDMITNELSTFETRFSLLKEELSSLRIQNSSLDERLRAELSHTLAQVADVTEAKNNKVREGKLLDLDKDLKQIEVKFAKMGINFSASDLFSSIARIAGSDCPDEVMSTIMQGISKMVTGTISGLIDGASSAGKSIVSKFISH